MAAAPSERSAQLLRFASDPMRRRRAAVEQAVSIARARLRDPRSLRLSALVLLLLGSGSAFAHIVEDYLTGDPIVRWDVRFARWLHEHASASLVSCFKIVTLGGNSVVLLALVALLSLLLLRRGRANAAFLLSLVFVTAEALNAGMKLAFHRERPELAFVHLGTYSFPSGHATVSAAVYGTLAFLVCERPMRNALRAAVVAGAVALVSLIAFSRLYLGAHYLSDVLAGVTFGTAWAALWLIAYTLYGERNVLLDLPAWARNAVSRLARGGGGLSTRARGAKRR